MILDDWKGTYAVDFIGKRDYSSDMFWSHRFILSDSCIYEGSGFQYYSKYICASKFRNDTLIIIADKNVDGYPSFQKGEEMIKIFKKGNLFYTNSLQLIPEEIAKKTIPLIVSVKRTKHL